MECNIVHAQVIKMEKNCIHLNNNSSIEFDLAIIASGTMYNSIFKPVASTSAEIKQKLLDYSCFIAGAQNIIVIGGGPTAIEFAGEVCDYYPAKKVIIITSASKLLPMINLSRSNHDRLLAKLKRKNISVFFGESVSIDYPFKVGQHQVVTKSGITFHSDLTINATGKLIPNTRFLPAELLNDAGFVNVSSTLQFEHPDYKHCFALGDVADTASAKVYHLIPNQVSVVVANVKSFMLGMELKKHLVPEPNPQLILVPLGRNDAFGNIPMVPFFLADWIARFAKGSNYYAYGFY
jgi:NADH dehydrogenase FAD-containing subunit